MDTNPLQTSVSGEDLYNLLGKNEVLNREDDSLTTVRGIEAFQHLLPASFFRNIFRKVLVVDDDPDIRQMYVHFLDMAGFDVCCVENGLKAISKIHQYQPDFVITDWNMPEINGIQLCQTLRRMPLDRYLYVLLVTSQDKLSDYVSGIAAGADDFLSKPIRIGELLSRLQAGTRFLELDFHLREIGRLDSLTGLYNRNFFTDILQHLWSFAVRHQRPLSCVMLEVDLFRQIDDQYGHINSGQVLKAISRIIQKICRGSDYLCRYEDAKFCILLPETSAAAAFICVERCQQALMEMPIHLDDYDVSASLSGGVAERFKEDLNPEQMLERADQALLAAR